VGEAEKVTPLMLNELHDRVKRITHTPVRVLIARNMIIARSDVGSVTIVRKNGEWCVVYNREYKCAKSWNSMLDMIEEMVI